MFEWKPFLSRWSRQLMTTSLAESLDSKPGSPEWLGFGPATEEEVEKLEERLGLLLPPSYRKFLLTSNGWQRTTPFIGRIRSTDEVNWLRIEHEQLVELYSQQGSELPDEEYYDYSRYAELHHRADHFSSLIQISEYDDGLYLLNPESVTPDGEWEAWFFANWVPGPRRYPSFAHLMVQDYQSFASLEHVSINEHDLPELKTHPPSVPRVPAERVRKNPPKSATLEALIQQMRSPEEKTRNTTLRIFHGKLTTRYHSDRRPDLIEPLTDLFYESRDAGVRCACVAGLTNFAEDAYAPSPLFDALSDDDSGVFLQGVFALHHFPNPRAVEPLCKFIDSKKNVLFNETAMLALGKIGDERAVPTLERVLNDTNNTLDQSFGTAAIALASCGERGFDVLVSALNHGDPRVRRAAVVGVDVSGDPRGSKHLDRMENDPDENVRERAKIRMGNPWK